MNVVAVLPLYVPHSRVGSWLTTHEYLAGLVLRGHHVEVVTSNSKRDPYEHDGVRVYPNGSETRRPHVLVSHLGDAGYGAFLARRLGVPSVRMVHGYGPDNRDALDKYPPTLAIFSSRALAEDTGWDGPTLIAHPPVFVHDYRVRPGHCVTLSNLSVAKGGLLVGWIADAYPAQDFLGVLGWGRQMERQSPNIRVIDPVEDMRTVYRQTRILLMPSERESYGRVAVEAACSGIPTIAHPSPGLVEAMDDAATWVDRRDRQGWIDAVGRLLDPDEWKVASTMAKRAIQKDPDATITTVCEAIERCAS